MIRAIYSFIFFKVIKWKIFGDFDTSVKKYIVIVAPHTSNWDFVIGIMVRSILKITDVKFIGKSQLFKWPYGFIFRAMGGHPVDRSKHNNLVEAVVEIFNAKEKFAVTIAPEGTRKKVDKFKTGFYHIAVKAKIPIYKVGFDFSKKLIVIDKPFSPTGNMDKDMTLIMDFYRSIRGKHPELGLS
ncbi:MAG: 1-acyl-sn-glycerol-3-phosphate acyltransferase [Cyclobacteriaceae bacterium]|nr:1-acyl-sn-glycerol-3-phosphate acyltransferase [Cyclobacteriaceae bacterium]